MHRQASFYANNWPEGTTIAEDGDVFAFYLPGQEEGGERPVLGGAEFVTIFQDRPEVHAVQAYMSSPDYNNRRAQEGSFISSNSGLDIENVGDPIQRLSLETIRDPEAVFRFDGSDLMPAAVGSGTLWRAMVDWLNGAETQQVLSTVEQSWPAS
jgi:alpha-glucoside transport system substrate-binding protein